MLLCLFICCFFFPGFIEVCLRLTFCFELRVNEICNDYGFWHLHHAWTPVCIDNFCKYRIFFFFFFFEIRVLMDILGPLLLEIFIFSLVDYLEKGCL